MNEFIHKTSQTIDWFVGLDNASKLILGGGFLALMLLLNWLWNKARSEKPAKRETTRAYFIPTVSPPPQPYFGPVNDDITEYEDVRYHARPLMSPAEINFWCLLYQAAPGYHIFPQVSAGALLSAQSPGPEHCRAALRALPGAAIDFVICDTKLNVVALVELNENTHDDAKEKDRRKDLITGQAGYRTVRFDCHPWPDVEQIKKNIFA